MTLPHTNQSATILSQLQELSNPVAVFLPGLTQESLQDPKIRETYNTLREQMETLRSSFIHILQSHKRGGRLSREGEDFLFTALPLAKELTTIMRLHMIKITGGRMQDLDYTKMRNAKYKEDNIPMHPFVQEQIRLMQCKLKDMNTHHIDKRSQYGISLPALLMTMHKGIHTILHMVTDNPAHEQEISHLLVPKKERELHSHKRRTEQTQTAVGGHEAISANLHASNPLYTQQLLEFPEKVESLYQGYRKRSDRSKNENYIALSKIRKHSTQVRNRLTELLVDGLLESLPGYLDTAVIINTIDTKDQMVYHLAGVLQGWKKYEQRMALQRAMYQEQRVPKMAKTVQAQEYMEQNWLSHESKVKRRTKLHMLSLLGTHHPDIPAPDALLTHLMTELTQLHTILPKFLAFRASDTTLGHVRGFSPDHSQRITKALSTLQKVLDTHDQTPFAQIFHDTLYQPLVILEQHMQLLQNEHLLQRPRPDRLKKR